MGCFFSILIPAYNMAGKMTKCIDSLKSQTFSDFEGIIVDDGSKDGTSEEIEAIAKADGSFTALHHGENKSLLAARYTAMRAAKGRYVLFLDSDDYIGTDTLQDLYDYLEKDPVDIVRFGYQTEPDGTAVLPVHTDDPLECSMSGKMAPAIWKNCYKRAVIEKVTERTEPFYCNMGEDVFLNGVLFSCADTLGVIDRVCYHYVTTEGMSSAAAGISVEKILKDMKSVTASGTNLIRFIEQYNPEKLSLTKRAVRTMCRFVLTQNTMYEPDYRNIVDRLCAFNTEEYRPIYEWGCRHFLPYIVERRINKGHETMEEKRAKYLEVMQLD
jgi:glycosyltransferase involved in cell wall biosynthesis